MQRSFSSSCVDHQHNHRSSTATCRHLPVRFVYNNANDYYSSDTDSHHQTCFQRAPSTSSFSSTSSACSANYRILPVRYSSVDRILPKITSNERGINVRIKFDRPHHHLKHITEESEHHRHKKMTKEHQEFASCPVLDGSNRKSKSLGQSNITYIETRSIVRGSSNDRINKNNHSNSMIIHDRSMPRSPIKHIPLNTNLISTRIIREKVE